MSGLKDIVKNGWHPEKDVPIKDSLKGLIGKGDKKEKSYHTPMPITSLRDPASFPPPPKHIATGATPSPPPGQPYRPPAAGASHQSYTSTHAPHQAPPEEPPAPKPFRIDTTGLSTSHLPPPPVRRPGGTTSTPSPPPALTLAKPPPPSLPPRLPPRTSTPTSPAQLPPPPARTSQPAAQPQGYLNQSAINSLSSKGISVPGFGIGSTPAPTSTSPQPSQAPGQDTRATGTTWAQKRAALQTASSIHKDPTSVSASDAASAASTFNNFRQRHGEELASATSRANTLTSGDRAATPPQPTPPAAPGTGAASLIGKKKPPPPPPAKKPGLVPPRSAAGAVNRERDEVPPPPVPLATRPRF